MVCDFHSQDRVVSRLFIKAALTVMEYMLVDLIFQLKNAVLVY